MVLKITKETWRKCGIKTIKHHKEKEDIIELWNKMSDVKIQLRYSNIYHIALKIKKRIKKYCGKRNKRHYRRRKRKYKAFFEGETGIFIIEKLARDIIERCKLPEAIELRKK